MWDSRRDTDVKNRLLNSVGEGKGGMIWEKSTETCILSCVKQIVSPGLMHDTGCSGLVHWDTPEGVHTQVSITHPGRVMAEEPLRAMGLTFSLGTETEHSSCCAPVKRLPVLMALSLRFEWFLTGMVRMNSSFYLKTKAEFDWSSLCNTDLGKWNLVPQMKSDFIWGPSTF